MVDKGLLNYLETFLTENRKLRFEEVLSKRTKHFTVAVEDVYQLHNTSAVIRSCDVFGIQEIHVVEERNVKKIDREIAMGAQKWVDIHRHHRIQDCLKAVKSSGYKVIATTPHEGNVELDDFDINEKACFFFGNEAEGLSDLILKEADEYLRIPMVGFTESLNISVSAAIILQYVTSKLRKSDLDWQLTENEKIEKKLDWIKKTIKSYDKIVENYRSR
ncbi:MAG: TrmH family RNA methyltransferase [Flavobacteriaceae bacterium]|nr:RNA methyltransferase [Bacteroidia bacterium]NNL60554.1 RNA methyltransferase [Flavobacteriaceae bacterium]RZV55031.1 MAG: TrmH family RNA methyltransferase [Flavobacteriaceae bacterium]